MKNEKNYIEKIILGEIDELHPVVMVTKAKKVNRFKKENPKKPKSKHHTIDAWEAELDID